jgi:predicted MFS family arabinose efflux permease
MSEQSIPLSIHRPSHSLAWQVGVATLSRLIINTARRFVYPFAPVLSRELGVSLPAITSLIAVNQATGLMSPLFGPLGDRWGYRVMMLAGLGLVAGGMLAGGLRPFYTVIILSLFLAGLGKSIFDPALQAYVGERVPFSQRGRVIGMIELSWAGSILIGIPLIGLLIDRLGWRAPFFVLAGLGLLGIGALRILLVPGGSRRHTSKEETGVRRRWRLLLQNRAALGALGYGFMISLANDNLFVIYGVWLENAFALNIVALGTASAVIGVAELLGELLTAAIADRLNLKRALSIGLALSTLSYALLPFFAQTLPLALVGLFLIFLTLEFTIVTAISFFTELLPDARATFMSTFVATNSIGRVAGAAIGGVVWLVGGLWGISLISTFISALALVCLLWGLQGWRPQQPGF